MDEARSEWLWRAVRIITFAVMAGLLFVSAMVLTSRFLSDLDLNVAGRETLSFIDVSEVPMGAVTLSPDDVAEVKDYIPLLGYLWWFGPFSLGLFFAVGLAIVYYSRHPRVPGSYLTPTTAAVGLAIVLFGVAAWPLFSCAMYEWDRIGVTLLPGGGSTPDPGCYGLENSLVPLVLGCIVLGFALFPPLANRLRERRGSTTG